MVKVNIEALHQLTGAFLPRMVEQGAGAVLNVASTAAFQPLPGFATYAASKAFVHSFSEALHSELSGTGVSVTSLCPGFTKTEFEQRAGAEDAAAKLPGFTWMESDDVARQAVEGMIAGKRTVVPGVLNKAVSTSGRYVPRTVLLPLVKTVSKNPRPTAQEYRRGMAATGALRSVNGVRAVRRGARRRRADPVRARHRQLGLDVGGRAAARWRGTAG